ncbi:MAG: DegT/DnrJ/EryC1/StrS aminotransferase family protein [Motiliproteus sp.]
MLNSFFPPWPSFSQDERHAVDAVLESGRVNYWTGDQGKLFEQEFAAYSGCQYGIALANGTLALELALRAVGIGEGDEVVVTSRTFIASASAIVMVGATPVFADVDPDSQNITAETIRQVISPKTKGVVCVHLAGWPCDMDPILEMARAEGLKVIEDCAQAHGASYKDRPVGSLGDVAAFSFCQDKIMSTGGEGGMLLTNNAAYWKKAWAFKDHGKDWDEVNRQDHPPGFRWLHNSFGSNYRLTEMQSAIGRVQLKKLDQWRALRKSNAEILNSAVKDTQLARITAPAAGIIHAHYKHYIFLNQEFLKKSWSRDRIMAAIQDAGVPCFSGSCSEIYLEKAFKLGQLAPEASLPVAKQLGETSLMFLVHPTILMEDMEAASNVVSTIFNQACSS